MRPGQIVGQSERVAVERQPVATQFVNFCFFKIDRSWRVLEPTEQQRGREEFAAVVRRYQDLKGTFVLPYSLVGLRADADFMLWRISPQLEIFQQMMTELQQTLLGAYMDITYSYLSLTKRSVYVDKMDPQHQNPRTHLIPGQSSYLFVYPFVKTRDWYQLSFQTRQGMMDEHIQVGSKYPSVKINTTYSFGLDDQEFVVAFETNDPRDFLNLVQELRETEASRYTLRDTPMFTCLAYHDIEAMLATT